MSQAADAKNEPVSQRDAVSPASPAPAHAEEGTPAKETLAELTAADLSSVPLATSGKRFLVAGLVASALLHACVLVYLLSDNAEEIGPGGIQLEAISVDLVPLTSLRSGVPDQAPALGNDAADQDRIDKTEAARREVTDTLPPEGLIKPTEGTPELAAAEIIKPDPIHEHRQEEADKEKPEKPQEPGTSNDDRGRAKETREARDAMVKGGAPVAATPGQISRYALSIQQTLNRNPPRHLGTRGRAVVEFGLTATGSVRFAQIAKSSGTKLLDDAVLAAIWKIRFPAPPESMTDRQRSYAAPVEFR